MKSGSRWFSVVKVVDRLLKKTGALGLMDDQPRVASNRKMPRTDPPIAAARFSASVLDGAASANEHEGHMKVLITGASGYVGSHLVPALLDAGHHVRAVARHPEVLEARGWEGVEIRRMDALDATSVQEAVSDMDAAYYLIHSMGGGKDFAERDRRAATIFATAAGTAGLQQIIYLGGLLPPGEASRHLTSRAETGSILRVGSVPVTELRAGIIVGPGSAAFEVIRDLVNHLPVMLTPRWVRSRTQPIALTDLLAYLVAMLDLPTAEGRILDVGGPQVLRYEDMLREAGRVLGHRVRVLSLPFLTPRLSSYWLDIVTAVPASVVRPSSIPCATTSSPTPARSNNSSRGTSRRSTRQSGKRSTSSKRRPCPLAGRKVRSPIATGTPILRITPRGSRSPRIPISRLKSSGARCSAWAVAVATPTETGSGACAAGSTDWSAAWGCGAAAATPRTCVSETPSISGGSSPWNQDDA